MTAAPTSLHPAVRASHGLTDGARSLLERRVYAVFVTQNADSTPHVAPVMFHFDGEVVAVETGAATRKARNVQARGRASILVQTPDAAWVLGTGSATVVQGADAAPAHDRLRAKYFSPAGRQACDGLLDEMDDVAILVTPDSWLGWDISGFMGTLAERGVDLAGADGWFLADE